MYLNLNFLCVQVDLEVVKQIVLLKTQKHPRNYSRRVETLDLDTSSIPVDLSRFNEP